MKSVVVLDPTGRVVNVVVLPDTRNHGWVPPEGHVLGAAGGEIGQRWDGSAYVVDDVHVQELAERRAKRQRRIQKLQDRAMKELAQLTPAQKLARIGLTVDELKQLLAGTP